MEPGGETFQGYDSLQVRGFLEQVEPLTLARWSQLRPEEAALIGAEEREDMLRGYARDFLNSYELDTSDPEVLLAVATGAIKIASYFDERLQAKGGDVPLHLVESICDDARHQANKLVAQNNGNSREFYGGLYIINLISHKIATIKRHTSYNPSFSYLDKTARFTAYTISQLWAEATREPADTSN